MIKTKEVIQILCKLNIALYNVSKNRIASIIRLTYEAEPYSSRPVELDLN
jgi:hypothetical protein